MSCLWNSLTFLIIHWYFFYTPKSLDVNKNSSLFNWHTSSIQPKFWKNVAFITERLEVYIKLPTNAWFYWESIAHLANLESSGNKQRNLHWKCGRFHRAFEFYSLKSLDKTIDENHDALKNLLLELVEFFMCSFEMCSSEASVDLVLILCVGSSRSNKMQGAFQKCASYHCFHLWNVWRLCT